MKAISKQVVTHESFGLMLMPKGEDHGTEKKRVPEYLLKYLP